MTWEEKASYLQKRGTVAEADKILIQEMIFQLVIMEADQKPVINSFASDYAIKAFDKKNISIKNLKIIAEIRYWLCVLYW